MSATPEPDSNAAETGDHPKKIAFRFCRECANLLYPKEDRVSDKLIFKCQTCGQEDTAQSSCVYRNELGTSAGDTAGITQDVASDPTVGLPLCTMCGQEIVCEVCGVAAEECAMVLEVDDDEEQHSPQGHSEMQLDNQPPLSQGYDAHSEADHDAHHKHHRISVGGALADEFNKRLPRSNKQCPSCGEREAVFFQSQQRTSETGMRLYYVCCHCGRVWQ